MKFNRIFYLMVCALCALLENSSPKKFLLCFHLEVLALYIKPTEPFYGNFCNAVKSEVQYFKTGCIVLQLPAAKKIVHFPVNYM